MEIDIYLESFNKSYNAGEYVSGTVNIGCNDRHVEFYQMNINITVRIYIY